MGQFFAVSSDDPSLTQRIVSQAARAAVTLVGREPAQRIDANNSSALMFSRAGKASQESQPFRADCNDTWGVAIGTWVERGAAGSGQTLERMTARYHDDRGLTDVLDRLDGTFCFVVGRDDGRSLRVITDPHGRLHVYALYMEHAVLISTSAVLLAHCGQCGWDSDSVREFLAGGTVYGERSLFRGVRKLPAATIQTFELGRKRAEHVYWSPYTHLDTPGTAAESLEDFADALQGAIADVQQRFDRPVLDLTGGFDSRIMLANARSNHPDTGIHTVVAGQTGHADVVTAGRIADTLGLRHQHIERPVDCPAAWWRAANESLTLTDGEYDMLEYANILSIHQTLFPEFCVSINGSGGELIRGYWWELLFPRVGARARFDSTRVAKRRLAGDPWAETLLASSYPTSLTAHFSGVIDRNCEQLMGARNTACMDSVYLGLRMQRWQGRIASAANRVWPCLSPMLFRRPVEAAMRAPIALRRNGRMARRLLARLDAQLAALPLAEGYPALPLNLRTVHRFTPLGREWASRFKKRVRRSIQRASGRDLMAGDADPRLMALLRVEEVADTLNPAEMHTADFYRRPKLDALCDRIVSGGESAPRVGRLLTLERTARLRRQAAVG